MIYERSWGPPPTSVWTLCIAGVTFLQPQGTWLGLHSLRPLLDVFSQETNLAPRKRGLFFSDFTETFFSENWPMPTGMHLLSRQRRIGVSDSQCRRALEVCADGQRAGIGLLQLGNGSVEIEQADVTDDEPLHARVVGDAANDTRRRMEGAGRARGNGEMHDQYVRALCEFREFRIGAVLVGAEHDRCAPRLDAIGERRDIGVRDSKC